MRHRLFRRVRIARSVIALGVAGLALPGAASAAEPFLGGQSTMPRVGINVGAYNIYGKSFETVDLMRQAGGFGLTGQPWKDPATVGRGPIALGADGWPTEDFAIQIASGWKGVDGVVGSYTIAFRGHATVALIASSGSTLGTPTYDAASGQTIIPIDFTAAGNQIILNFANTDGTVKDLRVLRPGYRWDDPNLPVFTKTFLDYLRPFSTLRFMDFTVTNGVWDGTWAGRPTPENRRGGWLPAGVKGVPGLPWEGVIELANAAHKDAWINIPNTVDADYVRRLAELFRDRLDPGLRVYVEYGNEMWNFSFLQASWLVNTEAPRMIAAGTTALNADGETNKYMLGARAYLYHLYEYSEIFRSVFGDAQMMGRIRPVFTWQGSNSGVTSTLLQWATAAFPNYPANHYLYAFSGAPYFNMADQQKVDGLTPEQVGAALQGKLDAAPVTYQYEFSQYLKLKYGLRFVAYEGGPDTFGTGSIASKAEINRRPAMETMCHQLLDQFGQSGGDLFMWYAAGAGAWDTQYGTWSLSETLDLLNPSPKYRCLDSTSTTPAPLPTSRHLPGTAFDAAEGAGAFLVPGTTNYRISRNWYKLGQTSTYVVSSPYRTRQCLPFSVTTNFPEKTAALDVLINDAVQLTAKPLKPLVAGDTWERTDLGNVCLEPGNNLLTLRLAGSANGQIDQLLLDPVQGAELWDPATVPPVDPVPTTPPPTKKPTTTGSGTTGGVGSGTGAVPAGAKTKIVLADAARCVRGRGKIPLVVTVPSGVTVRSITIGVAGKKVVVLTAGVTKGGIVRMPASVTAALRKAKAKRPSLRAAVLTSDGAIVAARLAPKISGRTCGA